jgi:GntR family transcriptional regulator
MEADELVIRPGAPDPIYRQIVDQLRRLIAGKQLPTGERLPSVREVAERHAINPMTVSRAYVLLESEGLIQRLRGKGMVVATVSGLAATSDRLDQLDPHLREVARQSRELGLSDRAVLDRLKRLLEKNK